MCLDVERAAATLPPTRFRPDLTPTATTLYAALLRAGRPLGRTDLIERAGISANSYDRRLSAVRNLGRVVAVQVDGHRRWSTGDAAPAPVGHSRSTSKGFIQGRGSSTSKPLVPSRRPATLVEVRGVQTELQPRRHTSLPAGQNWHPWAVASVHPDQPSRVAQIAHHSLEHPMTNPPTSTTVASTTNAQPTTSEDPQ